jgi:hypothetical protein
MSRPPGMYRDRDSEPKLRTRTIVVVAEGVLSRDTTGDPIEDGLYMFTRSFRDTVIVLTDRDPEVVKDWLHLNNFGFDLILPKEDDRITQLLRIKHEYGYSIDVVVEPDPAVCSLLVAAGFLTVGFFHPYFARAEWRPDYVGGVRPWNELVEESKALLLAATQEALDRRDQ